MIYLYNIRHVYSRFDSRLAIKDYIGACTICRAVGSFSPLILRPVSDLIQNLPDTVLIPCGHVLDFASAQLWSCIIQIPKPPIDPRVADSEPMVGPHRYPLFYHACPFCCKKITNIKRLSFTKPNDNLIQHIQI